MMLDAAASLVGVIEDDAVLRRALGRVLQAGGFETALFDSAEAFIAAPAAHPWLCLIVDVHLAGMSGIELQRRIHQLDATLPVIITTGDRADALREDAERGGCIAFLWKPVSADALFAVLRSVAQSSAPDPKNI